jgi:hypothetical protein
MESLRRAYLPYHFCLVASVLEIWKHKTQIASKMRASVVSMTTREEEHFDAEKMRRKTEYMFRMCCPFLNKVDEGLMKKETFLVQSVSKLSVIT